MYAGGECFELLRPLLPSANHVNDVSTAKLTIEPLSGPITESFDCGRLAQTEFLLNHAWPHQELGFSRTHVLRENAKLIGFVTLAFSEILLDSSEKPEGAPFATLPAVKLVQMGIDSESSGKGLGQDLFAFAVGVARKTGENVGCRYLILDSVPERVSFYETKCGCVINTGAYETRRRQAEKKKRDPNAENVSMRFDLRQPGQLNPSTLSISKAERRSLPTLMGFGKVAVFVTWHTRRKT